ERDHARTGPPLEYIPQRPSPEINVVVVDILEMTACARRLAGQKEIFEQRSPPRVTMTNPPAFAGSLVVAELALLAIVGRIPHYHPYRLLGHVVGAGMFIARPVQDVGQMDVNPVAWKLGAGQLQLLREAQMGDRVGSEQQLATMKTPRHVRRALGHLGSAQASFGQLEAVLERGDEVGPGSQRGV